MTTVSGLLPNTQYQALVTIETHGGLTITSQPALLTTADGAPEGLSPPQKLVINETAVRVSWLPPSNPNGEITGYFLYVDGMQINTGMTTAGSYLLTNLRPYTIYKLQVEVCTVYACIRSLEINMTTAESIPAGVAPPTLSVDGPSLITATWMPPQEANGILLRYELLRRIQIPCSQVDQPDTSTPPSRCTYLECSVLESFCGDKCYSGPKTCCDGVVYNNIQGYECCGSRYIPRRLNPDDVCCGGNFHAQQDNYVCCGSRYVRVLPGQICCVDPTQDRVDIGYGDQCCSSVPYSSTGAQICCQGELYAKYSQQCCGGHVVSDTLTCCGNATRGQAYKSNVTNTCCGEEFVPSDRTTCCGDSVTGYKAHVYESALMKQSANEQCCGMQSISRTLSCCNGVGFNPFAQFCADISTIQSGCGTGVVCPVAQEGTAFCNRCNFDQSALKCGSYVPKLLPRPQYFEEPTSASDQRDGELCQTPPLKVYTGMDLQFRDSNLSPFTRYDYSLIVVNSAGSSSSDFTFVTTAEDKAAGVLPPVAQVLPEQLDTVYLTWSPPEKPNGIILAYVLYRNDVEIYRGTNRQYRDDNAVLPYQTYRYLLNVCNKAGCVPSQEIQVSTLQAKPEQVAPPVVSAVSSSVLRVTWLSPGRPNGYITMYMLYELPTLGKVATVSSTLREYQVTGLTPYTSYTFMVSACTSVGCTNSTMTVGSTLQDRPQGLTPVRAVVVDQTTAELYWTAPRQPNGVITAYTLYSSTSGTLFNAVFTGLRLDYTSTGLLPGRLYWHKIQANTSVGGTESDVSSVTMPQLTPQGILAPRNVTVLSSEAIYVAWSPPTTLNGIIDQYRVLLNGGTAGQIEQGFGLAMSGQINALLPYTEYMVRIRVCLQGVVNSCGTGPGAVVRTLQAAPTGQNPPVLQAKGSNLIQLTWMPPDKPNGIITSYRLHRRPLGSSLEVLIAIVNGTVLSFVNSAPELTPYTMYEYRITASNSIGDAVSNWIQVRTLEATPQGMNPPTLDAIGAYSITLNWIQPFQPNGVISTYKVDYRRQLVDPASAGLFSVTVAGDVLRTSISGLIPYTTYELRVTAANSVGAVSSTWSTAVTLQAAPADVGPFSVEKIPDGTSLILTWPVPTRPNGVITNYVIYEAGNINAIYQGINRAFEYRRLMPFTEYTLQLEACTIGGCGRSLMQKVVTAEVAPSSQPPPILGSVNSTSVTLYWLPPLSASGRIVSYEVLRQTTGLRQKRQISQPEPVVIYKTTNTSGVEYEYTDTDIEPYSVYHYQIRASNSRGSVLSQPLRVETPQGAPTGLSPPVVSQIPNAPDQLQVTWSPPGRINGVLRDYQLQRNSSTPWSFNPDVQRQFTDTGLIPHTYYAYTVTACTQGGCTTSSVTVMQTPQTAPSRVSAPQLSTINATAIRVTWVTPESVNGEVVEYRLYMDSTVVYRGMALVYTASNLQPFQSYTFMLAACTSGGCTNSSAVSGRPNEDRPVGMQPPALRVTSSTSIEVVWRPPDQPNGVITSYELRRGGVLIYSTSQLIYTDYDILPGTTYSYAVTAYNSRGSAVSAPASATTYSSSPMGLSPPQLQALSPTTIRAFWSPPLNPNGDIKNYTLYVGTRAVYSDQQLTAVVQDLLPWTEYIFRVQACTDRGCTTSDSTTSKTLEAIPESLGAPKLTALADSNGAHSGILIQWSPPRRPNGVIDRYEVYRRKYDGVASGGSGSLVFSGSVEEYTDKDPILEPYTQYQYRVVAYNDVGQMASDWDITRTLEGPPVGVRPPIVKSTSATTITLELQEPERSNGYINSYTVFLNGKQVAHRLSLLVIIGEASPLQPYTVYTIYIEACTAGGCTPSPSIETRTMSTLPAGLAAPTVSNITASSAQVYWQAPTSPNGAIIAYELSMRMLCPYPYADAEDALDYPCQTSAWVTKTRGLDMSMYVTSLMPYTRYELRVLVENSMGSISASTQAITKPQPPVYSGIPFRIQATGGSVLVDWTESFIINGEVERFVFYKNDTIEFTGAALSYSILRTSLYATYSFQVLLVTSEGQAQTPRMNFDPTKGGGVLVNGTEVPDTTQLPVAAASVPVYQEAWFIALIVILALILIFIIIAVCFGTCWHRKVPYIRERMPLQPQQKKADAPLSYVVEPYDRSFMTELQTMDPHVAHSLHSVPHVGYINPAYSHLSIPSRTASLADLNIDRVSHKSVWDDDDSLWDGHPGYDSGLHSLAYGDDYDADSDRPISVLKEHTMFTDTHI